MKAEDTCIVVGGGDFCNQYIRVNKNDLVIAADKGYDYLTSINILPDIVIGDFDSVSQKPSHDYLIELPVEKDDTDMLASLRIGLDKGYKNFRIYGGTGGRIDHTFANIQCLVFLSKQNAIGTLFDKSSAMTVISDGQTFSMDSLHNRLKVSIFAVSEVCMGVRTSGLKYVLNSETLTNDFPKGVSNECSSDNCSVTIEKGSLLICFDISI